MMANRLNCNRDKLRNKIRLSKPALLSCLLIAALLLSCVSLARYIALSSDSTSARVAKFSVSAVKQANQDDILELNAFVEEKETGTYQFTVANNSEVDVKYSVLIRGVPDTIPVCLKADDGEVIANFAYKNGVYTASAKELAIGTAESCILEFAVTEDTDTDEFDATLQVQFEQID